MAHNTNGELRYSVAILGAFCIFLHSLVQLGAICCVHIVFLKDEILHLQTQNSCYAPHLP